MSFARSRITLLKLASASRPALGARPARPFTQAIRTYAEEGSNTPNASNVRNTPSANPESQQTNASRALDDRKGSPDTASIQNPVSDPQEGGLGAQEEPTPSQDKAKNDPKEPAQQKREKVEDLGNTPLDPADK